MVDATNPIQQPQGDSLPPEGIHVFSEQEAAQALITNQEVK